MEVGATLLRDLWIDSSDAATSPLPIYWRVYQVLREEICEGLYPHKELMPSESALAERFATSRITVRKALELLKSEGYIKTRQGVGTFTKAKLPPGSQPRSFTMNLSEMWRETTTTLLEFEFVNAPPNVASLLEVEPGATVHKAIRFRTYKRRPVGLLTTYIHERVARDFTRESFLSAPLITLFSQAGYPSATARQRINARSADPFSAKHLGVEMGAPLLCMMRVSRDASGQPISYLQALFRPDRYEIELDLEIDGPAQKAVWRLASGAESDSMPKRSVPFEIEMDPSGKRGGSAD
ncbi:MAG: GntR family transcriptional regulator [Chelatococcus sp.]|uniref:GntR family transcriptional regulator n=1 Tax=Chelatococcus sp. TaxID=1953771 RepID=UPI00224BB66F|nr:GntR family transcriptional regulator [Chelatococcus sp.]MBX3538486.1 GntR family transcriptional regulator [Chelatococcus sp.]CAH1658626.1 GntR family transcriptional regulator [Hyphomicrobiales bacterium]CAH1689956.1 GntR family transcriptional regulator [Hyphomicrobiales bacterium]